MRFKLCVIKYCFILIFQYTINTVCKQCKYWHNSDYWNDPRIYVAVKGVPFNWESNLNSCSRRLVGYLTGNQLVKRLYYRGHTNPQGIPVQSQMKLVHFFRLILRINFNIILFFTARPSRYFHYFSFSQ